MADVTWSASAARAEVVGLISASEAAAVSTAVSTAVADATAAAAVTSAAQLAQYAVEIPGAGFSFADRGGFVFATITENGFQSPGGGVSSGVLSLDGVQLINDGTSGLRIQNSEGFYVEVVSALESLAASIDAIPTPAPVVAPIISDGENMWGWRSKLAQILDGQSVTAKLLFIGDSWFQRSLIPDKIIGPLYAAYGRGADGWLCIGAHNNDGLSTNSWTMTAPGWTIIDATDGSALPFGIDGFRAEATGTTATLTTAGWWGASVNIYYRQTTGTFRYRIDGGSWTAVTGTGTNAIAKVSITGLSTTATHTLEIDLTGNTGTATLYGFYASGMPGIEIVGAGNGSAVATDFSAHINQPESQFILADVAPHCTLICLGNNDRTGDVPVATYSAALTTIMTQLATTSPLAPIVLMTAPRNGRPGTYPIEDYAAAMIALADGRLAEWVDYSRAFGPYADMNTLGNWSDSAHLSAQGARFYAQFAIPFLKL